MSAPAAVEVEALFGKAPDLGAIHSPSVHDIVASWSQIDNLPERISEEFKAGLIADYKEFHNMENDDSGLKITHNIMTDNLYSRYNLPTISAIHTWAKQNQDAAAERSSGIALFILNTAVSTLHTYANEHHCNLQTAYSRMRNDQLKGTDQTYGTFLGLMYLARTAAYACISTTIQKVPTETLVDGLKRPTDALITVAQSAEHAKAEYQESIDGVNFGEAFSTKLFDQKTKVVGIAIDLNSTMNTMESFANTTMIDSVLVEMQMIAQYFKDYFPEKELFFIINTGRPKLYVQAYLDLFPALPELRKLAIAELGRVIIKMEGSNLRSKTVIPEHLHWQESLNKFWYEWLSPGIAPRIPGIDPTPQLEPKETMLSFPIAKRREEGGEYLYTLISDLLPDKEQVTLEVVKKEFDAYFMTQKRQIEQRIKELEEKIINKSTLDEIRAGADGVLSTIDDLPERILSKLQQKIEEVDKEVLQLIVEEHFKLHSLIAFKDNLEITFNPTAGYIDIGFKGFNKYRPMIEEFVALGYSVEEILSIIIGDSGTDKVPKHETNPGEANQGADDVYSIAVHNCSPELREDVTGRGPYGVITARESVMGLHDTLLGIRKLIEEYIQQST